MTANFNGLLAAKHAGSWAPGTLRAAGGSEHSMRIGYVVGIGILCVVAAALVLGSRGPDVAPGTAGDVARVEDAPTPRLAPGRNARVPPVAAASHASEPYCVVGCIVDADGRPVPAARVGWSSYDGPTTFGAETDDSGRFTLAFSLLEADHFVVEAPDGRRIEVDVDDRSPADTRIRLPRVGPLRGRALLPDGRTPVAGARVGLYAYEVGHSHVRTGEDGRFLFAAVPVDREFRLTVEAGVHGRSRLEELRWAPDIDLEVVLPTVFSIRGRVVRRDAAGELLGLPGVLVRASYMTGGSRGSVTWSGFVQEGEGVLTGEDGTYLYAGLTVGGDLDVVSDEWQVVKPRPRCRSTDTFVEVEVEPRRRKTPTTPPKRTAWLAGSVLDEGGAPVPGAVLRLWWRRPVGAKNPTTGSEEVLTDSKGRFRHECLDPAPHDVSVGVRGYEFVSLKGIEVSAEGTTMEPIRLVPLAARTMVVLGEDGAGLPTAEVSTRGFGYHVPVDANGHVQLHFYANGRDKVSVRAPGHVERKLTSKGAPEAGDWVVQLARAHVLAGLVLDAEGRPVRSAFVLAKGEGWSTSGDGDLTDLAGRFRVDVPVAGTYRLRARRYGLVFGRSPEVETGAEDVVLQAVVPSFVAGRLVDPDGNGVEGVWLTARPEGGGEYERDWTDADGRFRIDDLAPGTVRLEAQRHDDDLVELGLALRPRKRVETGREDVLLVAERTLTISGVVLWPDGRPAAVADVSASRGLAETEGSEPVDVTLTETDERGRFELRGLLPGVYGVTAYTWVSSDDEDAEDAYFDASQEDVEMETRNLRLVLQRGEDDS